MSSSCIDCPKNHSIDSRIESPTSIIWPIETVNSGHDFPEKCGIHADDLAAMTSFIHDDFVNCTPIKRND